MSAAAWLAAAAIFLGVATARAEPRRYTDASEAFQRATKAPPGPARDRDWRIAAELYREVLESAPGRDEAPEAALNGAQAFRQLGEPGEAVRLLDLFVREYGAEALLATLEKGDPRARPPRPPDPRRYEERVRFVKLARERLAAAAISTLDFEAAATTFEATARSSRLDAPTRRDAARNSALLRSARGERDAALDARRVFAALSPSREERAEVDLLAARGSVADLDAFVRVHGRDAAAGPMLVRALHESASLLREAGDARAADRCRAAVAAYDTLVRRTGGGAPPEADLAAECAYRLVDERLARSWDDPAEHRYAGPADRVRATFERDLERAAKLHDELGTLITSYPSASWGVAALARQGTIYDACVRGLVAAGGAVELEPAAEGAYRVALRRYVEAIGTARKLRVHSREVDLASRRVALLADRLGDARVHALLAGMPDPESPGHALQLADGQLQRQHAGMRLPAPLTPDPQATLEPGSTTR